MTILHFVPYKDTKKANQNFFEQRFVVLKIGPCDTREFEHYEKYGLPRSPERLELPIFADKYVIGPELTQRDAYYALCLEEDLQSKHYARRVSDLSKRLPISKKEAKKIIPQWNGSEIISLEVIL